MMIWGIFILMLLSARSEATASFVVDPVRFGEECANEISLIDCRSNQPDRVQIENAFKTCLSRYIQLPTVNPPGHEELAVAFLKTIFDRLRIPTRVYWSQSRPNLVATLAGGSSSQEGQRPVLLYHHTDVVPVFPDQWLDQDLPFSGRIAAHPSDPNGPLFIWGRGALDMKSVGIMQLLSVAMLKASGAKLERPIHLIASADEESGGTGAIATLQAMAPGGLLSDLRSPHVLLNEGGSGLSIRDRKLFLFSSEEKGGAWLRLKHPDLKRLVRFLDRRLGLSAPVPNGLINDAGNLPACELVSFFTPGAKINISPSITELQLLCRGSVSRSWKSEIHRKFSSAVSAAVAPLIKVKQTGSLFRVRIELSSSGHSSASPLSTLQIALNGLKALHVLEHDVSPRAKPSFYRYQTTPATQELIEQVLPIFSIPSDFASLIRRIPFFNQLLLRILGKTAYSETLFRTACSWTSLELKPDGNEAWVDCRLVHTGFSDAADREHAEFFRKQLVQLASDPALDVQLVNGWNHTQSPLNGDPARILSEELKKLDPTSVVSAYPFPASSDSAYFRAPHIAGSPVDPIPSYGFMPTVLSPDLLRTFHGSDERFPVSEAAPSTIAYLKTVQRLASEPLR